MAGQYLVSNMEIEKIVPITHRDPLSPLTIEYILASIR